MIELHSYRLYGFNVNSEIPLDAEKNEFDDHDIQIKYVHADEESSIEKYVDYNKDYIENGVRRIGKFTIRHGSRIQFNAIRPNDQLSAKIFMETKGFSALMAQNGKMTLHGSGLRFLDKTILILGRSGAGKSSLTSGLINKGAKLLSDDFMPLHVNGDIVGIHKGFNTQRLHSELVSKFDLKDQILGKVIYPGVERNKFFINRKNNLEDMLYKIDHIFDLRVYDDLSCRSLTGREKLVTFFGNLYRTDYIDYYIPRIKQFEIFNKLQAQASFNFLRRPYGIDTIENQIQLILEVISDDK